METGESKPASGAVDEAALRGNQAAEPDRRALLAAGTKGLAGMAVAAALRPLATATADEPAARDGYVDAHVHVWTPETETYPLSGGYRRDEMRPASFTPEELLAQATPCGVTRIVLIQMSFYGFDNRYMLAAIAARPRVFAGVGVIDDEGARPALAMRELASQGVTGFRIYPRNRPVDRWLDGPGMRAMWAEGAQSRQAMCCLINPDALPAIDAMCEQYADTPVVIDHFARIGVDGQLGDEDIAQLTRLARHKNTYVKISAFYALGRKTPPYTDLVPMIRRLYDAFGPQRLMWATDCPYQMVDHTYAQSLELVRDRLDFASAEDKDWMLGKTALGVFYRET